MSMKGYRRRYKTSVFVMKFRAFETKGSSPIPKQEYPPLRVVYFSGKALTEGVETHVIQNVPVRVYSVAKTIADSNTEVVVRYQHCSIQPEFWLQDADSMCCLYGLKGL